jgi:hypothetical protein
MHEIIVQNHSTILSDAQLKSAVPSFQKQVDRDFFPVWGSRAHLRFEPLGYALKPGQAVLGVFDDADQAGALGYHDITAHGDPVGKVFARTTLEDGASWSVCFSHELLELLADPWVMAGCQAGSRFYALEVCDAVEADECGYTIDGVLVSDFVKPSWFLPDVQNVAGGRSFCGHVTQALELAKGGYISYYSNGSWHQVDNFRRAPKGKHSRQRRREAMLAPSSTSESAASEPLLQFFAYEHLPDRLQAVSRPFGDLARQIVGTLPRNPERTVALRKLLESKDCAVRALLFKAAT